MHKIVGMNVIYPTFLFILHNSILKRIWGGINKTFTFSKQQNKASHSAKKRNRTP